MNKTELIASVAEKAGITKKDAERVVNATFESITESLIKGDRVQVAGFGIFQIKHRNARTATNPHTKESVELPACNYPSFKPSKTLKDKII